MRMNAFRDLVLDRARDSKVRPVKRVLRMASGILLMSVGYYAGGALGILLGFPPSGIAAIWPSTAILLAALMLARLGIGGVCVAVVPIHLHVVSDFQQPRCRWW
jgi:hypothetical protein